MICWSYYKSKLAKIFLQILCVRPCVYLCPIWAVNYKRNRYWTVFARNSKSFSICMKYWQHSKMLKAQITSVIKTLEKDIFHFNITYTLMLKENFSMYTQPNLSPQKNWWNFFFDIAKLVFASLNSRSVGRRRRRRRRRRMISVISIRLKNMVK